MSSISNVDIRDWERAEQIIDSLETNDDPDLIRYGVLTWDEWAFIDGLIQSAKAQYNKPKLPAILSWWRAE